MKNRKLVVTEKTVTPTHVIVAEVYHYGGAYIFNVAPYLWRPSGMMSTILGTNHHERLETRRFNQKYLTQLAEQLKPHAEEIINSRQWKFPSI